MEIRGYSKSRALCLQSPTLFEKVFQCFKTFARSDHLSKHKEIHSKEKTVKRKRIVKKKGKENVDHIESI